MSGAAGALVLVASAAASPFMSAEALLSVLPSAAPAPAATTVAASGEDAVLFGQALDQAAPPADAAPANDDAPAAAPMSITPPAAPRLSFAALADTALPAIQNVSGEAPVETLETDLIVTIDVSTEFDLTAATDTPSANGDTVSADPLTCAVAPPTVQPEPVALPASAPVDTASTPVATPAPAPAPVETALPALTPAPVAAPATVPMPKPAPLAPASDATGEPTSVTVDTDANPAPAPAQPVAAPSAAAPTPALSAPVKVQAHGEGKAETFSSDVAPEAAPTPAQPQASAPSAAADTTVAASPAVVPADKPAPAAERAAADLAPAASVEAAADTTAPAPAEIARAGLSHAAIDATAQIAAQIIRRHDARTTRFEMSLLPEELGRVDVKLDIDSEGRLAARLAFDNPAAALDMRGRADELRRQLEQAGFHVADDAFEFADRDSGSHAFDRGQDSRREPGRAFAHASRLLVEVPVTEPRRSGSLTPRGVDMKV